MIETKYKVGEVVYVVQEFRVVKSIIESIVVRKDAKNEKISYNVYEYAQKNNPKRKTKPCLECYIVKDFDEAKQSAITNWKQITEKVMNDLNNLSDDIFEPKKNMTIVHGEESDS